jgi:hypothetical protein
MPLVALRVTEKTATAAYKYPNYETKGSAGTEKCHGRLKSAPAARFRLTSPKKFGESDGGNQGNPYCQISKFLINFFQN